MILLYLITPFLGILRNYIKYKNIRIFVFLRTPLIYFFINILFKTNNIWKTMVLERWFFFIYKSLVSLYKNDYKKKKKKYIKKYGLKYNI